MHTPKFGEKARSYCSTTCAERARRLLGLFSNSRFRRDRAERNGDKFNVQEIYERDRWKCGICFKKVNKNLKYPNPMSASLDHIVPLALGGTHTRDNVQLAHLKCNIAIGIEGTKQLRLHG
ncbi:HNH endonuclease [bacterium]|nr:HNH endonuclease [bacterium]